MSPGELHRRTVAAWTTQVAAVGVADWERPTPCREWSVRDLVNHITAEDLWTVPLLEGATVEEVGDRYDGDLLGTDPASATAEAAQAALTAVEQRAPVGGTVALSYGTEQLDEYLYQLSADHLVHAWDLAVAVGGTPALDPELVATVAAWFDDRAELYRAAGMVAAPAHAGSDRQDRLVAAFGRDPSWGPSHACLAAFSSAFGSGDVDAIMALMTEDCVFESTSPAPDGERREGAAAVRQVWEELFGGTAGARFTEEEAFVSGNRGVLRWRFTWRNDDGTEGHVRGADVLAFRDGLVSEKLSYVKG